MLRHEFLSKPKFEITPRSIVKRPVECVDAGSAYCPCQLAELGQCIECSLLRGEDECRCHWAGSCIWSHSQWGRGKIRQSCKFPILQQWEHHEGAIIVLLYELRRPLRLSCVRQEALFSLVVTKIRILIPLLPLLEHPQKHKLSYLHTR